MKRVTILFALMSILVLVVAAVPVSAQAETACLITDLGRINDGSFNQSSYEGLLIAQEEYDLDITFIETQSEADYGPNIATCVDEGYEIIITVGFLLTDATIEAAEANPDIFFIGVDQFIADGPENLVGLQFAEDQSGFMAGVLAAIVADEIEDSDTIAGVYGIDIPPVKRFRNGFEQGARYINPDINILGVYIPDFVAPDLGASAAEQFIGEGASVIFGAGGPTGSGGITAAAQQGVWVIGVDKDEYTSTFGNGETPGSEKLISSAMKRLDEGVSQLIAMIVEERFDDFPGGGNYTLDASLNGVGLADKHDADIPDEVFAKLDEIFALLASGELTTGVDSVSGDLIDVMDDGMDEEMDEDMSDEDMSDEEMDEEMGEEEAMEEAQDEAMDEEEEASGD